MWYIFKDGKCLCTCNGQPDIEDLEKRGEIAVYSDLIIADASLIDNNVVQKQTTKSEKLTALKAEYDPQMLIVQTQISIAVSVTKSVTAETAWRNSLSKLQTELQQKKMVIMNG